VVVGIAILVGYFAFVDDDEPTRSTTDPEGELLTCPDSLEVAGPYRRGIDPAYDARMDWDGDGVSCES
jgi:hypothetical protein